MFHFQNYKKLLESIIQKINFLNFMVNMENTKNDWYYYIKWNIESYMFIIKLSIDQKTLSYTKSYKNDKMEKCIFVRIFKLTFVSFSKL